MLPEQRCDLWVAAVFRPAGGIASPARLNDIGTGTTRQQELNNIEVSPVGGFVERSSRRPPAGSYQNVPFGTVTQKRRDRFSLSANARIGKSFLK